MEFLNDGLFRRYSRLGRALADYHFYYFRRWGNGLLYVHPEGGKCVMALERLGGWVVEYQAISQEYDRIAPTLQVFPTHISHNNI